MQKNVLLNGVDSSTENAGSFHAIFQKKISCTIRGEEEKLSTYLAKKFQIREDLALHLRVIYGTGCVTLDPLQSGLMR